MIDVFFGFNNVIKSRLSANFFRKISTDCMIPFLTIHLTLAMGSFYAGLVILTILCAGVVANIYGGMITSSISSYKILLWGELLHTIVILSMSFFVQDNDVIFTALYFTKSLLFSLLIPAGEVIIYANTEDKERPFVYQFNFWINNISTPIAISLGAFLFNHDVRYVIYLSSLSSFMGFIVYVVYPYDENHHISRRERNCKKKNTWKDYRHIYDNKSAFYIILSAVLLCSIEFSFFQYFPVYLSKNEITAYLVGHSFSSSDIFAWGRVINTLLIFFLSAFVMNAINRCNSKNVLPLSVIIFTLCFISMFYFSNIIIIYFLSVTMLSLMEIIYAPLRQTLFSLRVDPIMSGMYFSAYSLSPRIGNIISSLILMISDDFQDETIFILFLILGLTSAILLKIAISEPNEDVK